MKLFKTLFLILVVLFSGCVQKKNDTVLARFAGHTITRADFDRRIESLPENLRAVALRRKKELVEEMVDERFLEKEARRRNIENQPDVKELLGAARRKILVAKLIDGEVDRKISLEPDEAQKHYEANKEQYMTPLLFRASHIQVATEEEARAVRKELLAGADFEELARNKSLDSTRARGGDIGFFQKGQLIPEIETAAFAMRKGELSEPVKTQFGYHIIRLTDRAEPTLRDFKLVKGLVERQLINQKRITAYREFVQKLRGNAKVVIDEKALEAL
ncbi:MAG: peptidylprolyl isomerase [Candidatus Omnitrophota bacterium]